MALSEEVKQQIAFAREHGFDKLHRLPAEQTRAAMRQAPRNPRPVSMARVLDRTVSEREVPVRIYIPRGSGPFPVVAYYHGGGFVLMSLDTHDDIARELADRTGAVVMSVDYSLAPERPYPAGPRDSVAAARWLVENAHQFEGDGSRLALAGDSAGGYMALHVARELRELGVPVRAQFAAYPVTDHYGSNHGSWQENAEGYVLSAEMMRWFWDNFLPDAAKAEEASLLRGGNFSGLAPAMIVTAHYDPLRDEGAAYAGKLGTAGVEVHYKDYENVHGFFGTGALGREAMEDASSFLRRKLS